MTAGPSLSDEDFEQALEQQDTAERLSELAAMLDEEDATMAIGGDDPLSKKRRTVDSA